MSNNTYAILGATGNCGQVILEALAPTSHNTINCLVRSRPKLEKLSPSICAQQNVHVYQGSIDDILVLKDCIKGTKAVFLCVAAAQNVPGCSIAQDTARSVLKALHLIKEEDEKARLPKLVVLSSASTSPHFSRNIPHFAHALLMKAMSQVYGDLSLAEDMLRSESSFVASTFVKPGAMVHDVGHGHVLSTEVQQSPLSWRDLAAGMVEIADEGDEGKWEGKEVTVTSKEKAAFAWDAPVNLFYGLLCHLFPGLFWAWSRLPGF